MAALTPRLRYLPPFRHTHPLRELASGQLTTLCYETVFHIRWDTLPVKAKQVRRSGNPQNMEHFWSKSHAAETGCRLRGQADRHRFRARHPARARAGRGKPFRRTKGQGRIEWLDGPTSDRWGISWLVRPLPVHAYRA